MKSKKILIICTSLNMGGAERKAVWLANKMSIEHTVYFFSLKSSGILSSEFNQRVIIKNFDLVRSKNIFSKLFYIFIGWFRLKKVIKDENITTVISFLFHSNLYAKLVKLFSTSNFKHIIAVRSDRLSKRGSNQNFLRMFLFKKIIIDKKTIITFNSKAGLTKFNLNKKYNQFLIYNSPTNLPKYYENKINRSVYVGRLDELKNTISLVKAIKILREKNKFINLDIYGKGPDLPSLKKFVTENMLDDQIIFKGIDSEISNHLNKYECLLLTSTHEGFPNVLIEAMRAKTLCISTKVGDAEELLSENRGILVSGYDAESIADAIDKLTKFDSDTRDSFIENAYRYVENNLAEEEIFLKWQELVE